MFEKIKNFLYDISDIVLSLLIIGVIFSSVTWKISTALDAPPNVELTDRENIIQNPIVVEVDPEEVDEDDLSAIDSDMESNENLEETGDETDEESTSEPEKPLVLETFVISEGMSSYAIGQKLEREGFIKNTNDFVQRILELGVDRRLRSGSFQLSKSDNLDTIISVITGGGR